MTSGKMLKILEVVNKYNPEATLCAEHDIIFLGLEKNETSEEDTKILDGLGCHIEDGMWAKFV